MVFEDENVADQALEAEFGYKPVFRREFGYLATFSFAFSVSGLFATTATTFSYPLEAGGSASAVWCWLISGAGCMCIACSVAELVSAYPTSGGLYFTVSRLVPDKWIAPISWYTGWINLLGQIAGVASSEYGAAQMLLAAVSMGRNFQWFPTTGLTVGVMAALMVFGGLINSMPTKWMEKLTRTYAIFHLAVLVSCAIALLAKTDDRHDAKYVFTHVESKSGWTPIGWSFMFGFLSVSWTMTDYDATAHITEEVKDPEVKAPWSIFLAMGVTYVLGFLFNIVLCFCMGNPDDILNSQIDQPVAQLFYNSLGRGGGIFYTVMAFIILQFVVWASIQSLARTIFAFSRDGMLPASRVWTKIEKRTAIPQFAVWLSVVCCICINLIALGSYDVIESVFNICSIAMDWSYCIPIFCKLVFGRFQPGPWHLGWASPFINAWACLWTLFVSVIFFCPTSYPTTPGTMNYAIAFFGGIIICAGIFWFILGHKRYTGPRMQADDAGSGSGFQDERVKNEKEPAP